MTLVRVCVFMIDSLVELVRYDIVSYRLVKLRQHRWWYCMCKQ